MPKSFEKASLKLSVYQHLPDYILETDAPKKKKKKKNLFLFSLSLKVHIISLQPAVILFPFAISQDKQWSPGMRRA